MTAIAAPQSAGELLYRPAGTGSTFWGPGDLYRFLVTGEETGGAYFAMEAVVPPGGGPPPHIHRNEDETFYVVEGTMDFLLGDAWIAAGVGDFVGVPISQLEVFPGSTHFFGMARTALVLDVVQTFLDAPTPEA